MPKMYLRQPRFTYSICGQFSKSKDKMQKFEERGDSRSIFKKELDKACFQHDVAYGDFKGCVHYIFTSLFFKPKQEHLSD